MADINMTKEQRMLFNLVGHNLFSAPLESSEGVDWSRVLEESIAQSLPLLTFKNLSELPIGPVISETIKRYLKKCAASNINCFNGHKYLHELMSKNGIPYSVIKGAASAYYYPDPRYRSMGDVDFYVAPEHFERAKEVLLSDGFELHGTLSKHHICLSRGSWELEMHYEPIAIPSEDMRPVFTEYWSDLCDKAEYAGGICECSIPSEFHHGFILITHFQLHLMPNGVGLRHLCDWAVFANRFSNEKFVEVFESRLKMVGLWRLAQIMSLASVKYLGMEYKAWMGEDYATADALIEDIARGGNFGQREKARSFEGVFISDYSATDGRSKSRFARAFRTLNKYVREKWSAVRWCPLLYPVGWVYFSLRFLVKRITGRRSVSVMDSYKKSGKRLKLYKSLDLYKPEK